MKKELYKNQMLDLNKNDLLQVYDYFSNELYIYFEKNLTPRLKNSSFECQLEEDKKKQSEFLSYLDNFREVIENINNK